jgi:hypothetical protein
MKQIITIIGISGLAFCSCNNTEPSAKYDTIPEPGLENLPAVTDIKTVLPQAGYVELIEMNCTPCHSLRYIEMQPLLTYKTWEKTIDKMIAAYGAPIRDTITKRNIINYLYAIKGKSEH